MVDRAVLFANLIKSDDRFELVARQHLGLVCFRLKVSQTRLSTSASNEIHERLLNLLDGERRIHLTPSKAHDIYSLRLSLNSAATEDDVKYSYDVICELASTLK